jgi:hypothetical protein
MGIPREVFFRVRLCPIELTALKTAAKLAGMSASDFVRVRVGLKLDQPSASPPPAEPAPRLVPDPEPAVSQPSSAPTGPPVAPPTPSQPESQPAVAPRTGSLWGR